MSKVDLTSLEWCELIFKDRNKSYGAYKMRRDLGKRQAAALIISLLWLWSDLPYRVLSEWLCRLKKKKW